jgi:isopentenyl diphosphate isomerase/L-lactate dehydrogenase-like FMN-dependent dehydrogenase
MVAHRRPILRTVTDTTPGPVLAYPPRDLPPVDLATIASVRDFEAPARERIHPAAWAYLSGGSWDGRTLRANDHGFDAFRLRPRVLRDVTAISPVVTVLGRPSAMPVGIAPAALHALAHPDAELATVRAAAAEGAIVTMSTVASRTIEEVAAAAPDARRWFQLYAQHDWGFTRSLVERAAAAGYEALVLTVDLPVLGYRDDLLRVAFDPGAGVYANLPLRDTWRAGRELDELIDLRNVPLTWDALDEIRSWAPLPLVLKGVMTGEDARLAVDHGADAVWVSNHGGRQLDRVQAPVEVLGEVVDAVEGRAEVYLDGGIRRGPDVLIALALGANAVFTARPLLWALACAGEPGVVHGLRILKEEVARALALLGASTPAEVTRDHVRRVGPA